MSSTVTIKAGRLWDSLMETARLGGTPDGGIARLTLSDEDRQARDWLAARCAELGMSMTVDEVGNMFAVLPGQRSDLLPIAMGSHLDTQPTGGKFDGVLGVLAGLEVVRSLKDAGIATQAPLMIVNWTNEEGSRFSPAMLGSGVHAGVYTLEYCNGRQDVGGVSFGTALDGIGYRGAAAAGSVRLGALFEVHIEQGPILDAEGVSIGVVQGVQGMRWHDLVLSGVAAHTGSTPMSMRHDALLGMARVIGGIEAVALRHPNSVASVGFVEVRPNSHNVIPGEVRVTIDLRHPDDAVLDEMETEIEALVAEAARERGLAARLIPIARTPAVAFDAECIASVRAAAAAAGLTARDIISGAGHDSVHIARRLPTTMIFIPCDKGLSHNPAESATRADCAAGAQVLLGAVLDYDKRCLARLKGDRS